jgi:hypothetical protein
MTGNFQKGAFSSFYALRGTRLNSSRQPKIRGRQTGGVAFSFVTNLRAKNRSLSIFPYRKSVVSIQPEGGECEKFTVFSRSA